jgi:hypothetical protein
MHPSKDLYRRLVVRRGLLVAVHLGARPPQHADDHRPQRPEVTIPDGGAFLALVSAAKTERFRELLAEALNDGELLYLQEPVATLQVVKEWARQAANLIQVGYGTGKRACSSVIGTSTRKRCLEMIQRVAHGWNAA